LSRIFFSLIHLSIFIIMDKLNSFQFHRFGSKIDGQSVDSNRSSRPTLRNFRVGPEQRERRPNPQLSAPPPPQSIRRQVEVGLPITMPRIPVPAASIQSVTTTTTIPIPTTRIVLISGIVRTIPTHHPLAPRRRQTITTETHPTASYHRSPQVPQGHPFPLVALRPFPQIQQPITPTIQSD